MPAFVVHFLLVNLGFEISLKPMLVFFVIHLVSLFSIILVDRIKKGLIAYIYLAFLILKMVFVLILIQKTPEIKQNIILHFIFYWYYLILETFIVVKLLKNNIKFSAKKV